jgi:OOP family OmpA-OmpF porin
MKHLKITLLVLLFIAGLGNVNAQDEDNPWAIGIGINAVDFYPVNSQSLKFRGYGGSWFEEFANASDHYNTSSTFSRISVGRYIKNSFSVELAGSMNKIEHVGTEIVNDLSFFTLDASVKYSASSLFDTGKFEPYAMLGVGVTWIDGHSLLVASGGLGLNYWFSDNFGLNAQSVLKEAFKYDAEDLRRHFQHSVSLVFKFGGKDADGDGIYDKNDACPEVFGLEEFGGCPDTDGDGIIDSEDNCPDAAGEFGGCPDTDSDGLADDKDACPETAGPTENGGCPWPDTDGDGVLDKDDKCIDVAGPAENNGCVWPDADGDGVADKDDECPDVFGSIENGGCVRLPESIKNALDGFASTIDFDNGKATLKNQIPDVLKLIKDIILDYPSKKFVVAGHTSDTGSEAYNQKLSIERAEAVKTYLVENGVDGSLISIVGYGESKPLVPGKSREARKGNRRVEIKLAID